MPININFLIKCLGHLDPQVFTALKAHVGKAFEIKLLCQNRSFYFTIHPNNIETSLPTNNSHLIVSGTLGNFIALFFSKDLEVPSAAFAKYGINLIGEVGILQALHEAFLNYEPDWQTHIEPAIGSTPTFLFNHILKKTTHWIHNFKVSRQQDLALFLQEEAKMSPTSHEITHFCEEVDKLQEATDRLQKKIEVYLHGCS